MRGSRLFASHLGLEAQHVVEVVPGIHGRLVVADRRIIQLHAEHPFVAVVLQNLVNALKSTMP